MLFFLALIIYIASVVACLICFIVAKNIPKYVFKTVTGFHIFFLASFLIYLVLKNQNVSLPVFFPLSLLFFCCSGILLFGLTINQQKKLGLKIYSGIFILTFPVFLIKPSFVIHFMLNMEIKNSEPASFRVKDNMLLQFQPTTTGDDTACCRYKLVLKHGMFTQTLRRDIQVGYPLDSIHTIAYSYPGDITLNGYFKNAGGSSDSTLITISNLVKK